MKFSTIGKKLVLATAGGLVLGSVLLGAPSPVSVTGSATVAGDPSVTFMAKCASCHAKDGSGNTAAGKKMGVKDLRSAEVQGMSDAQLTDIIGKGKGKMPGYHKSLGADGVKEQVAYIRSMK